MKNKRQKYLDINVPRILLIFLLFIVAMSAFFGSYGLIGSVINGKELLPASYLANSPFNSVLIPGIILFLFIGVFPSVTIYGLASQKKSKVFDALNIYKDRHWSFAYSIYSSIILMLWLIIEQYMVIYNILQTVYFLIAVTVLILALLPQNVYPKKEDKGHAKK